MANVTRLTTPYSQLPVESPPPLPPGPPGPKGEGGASSVVSVRQIFGTLRRHKLLIGGLALMGTVIAWLIANQMTPMYRSEAQVAVEPKEQDPNKPGTTTVYVGAEFVMTEA